MQPSHIWEARIVTAPSSKGVWGHTNFKRTLPNAIFQKQNLDNFMLSMSKIVFILSLKESAFNFLNLGKK